jgi:mRNA-decapping enzyme 1B
MASIEGALYVVRRAVEPFFLVIISNQLVTEDLIEVPTTDWDLDVHPNYLLYRLGDGTIKGWWFHDDEERKTILREVSALLEELKGKRSAPPSAPPPGPAPVQPVGTTAEQSAALLNMLVGDAGGGAVPAGYPPPNSSAPSGDAADQFSISKARLRSTLVELVSSDRFLDDLIIRLRQA